MTSYGLSEMVLYSGGAHMTSHNKQHGGLHMCYEMDKKNAHNFIRDDLWNMQEERCVIHYRNIKIDI